MPAIGVAPWGRRAPRRVPLGPVVPVSITGSRHVMKKGRLMVCPGEVELCVHPPIPTADVNRDDVLEFAARVREIVRSDAR